MYFAGCPCPKGHPLYPEHHRACCRRKRPLQGAGDVSHFSPAAAVSPGAYTTLARQQALEIGGVRRGAPPVEASRIGPAIAPSQMAGRYPATRAVPNWLPPSYGEQVSGLGQSSAFSTLARRADLQMLQQRPFGPEQKILSQSATAPAPDGALPSLRPLSPPTPRPPGPGPGPGLTEIPPDVRKCLESGFAWDQGTQTCIAPSPVVDEAPPSGCLQRPACRNVVIGVGAAAAAGLIAVIVVVARRKKP
jgi:hypothetical protein